VAAVDPRKLILAQDFSSFQRPVNVIAAGKASSAMLRAFEERVPIAHAIDARGSHPLPDDESVRAGREALLLAGEARASGRQLVLLLSGGASAMLAAPVAGMTLDTKRRVTERLLSAGVTIHELNAVRKHLSAVKGGRLAAASGRCTTFALSDVADDDPSVIGSGPGAPDPSTIEDARRVLRATGIADAMPEVMAAIERGGETPKPEDPLLTGSRVILIGGRRTAMDGVVEEALRRELATILFDEPITGDAVSAGAAFARRAIAAARRVGGAVVIASGETTVRVTGQGRGGRNQEFALGAAMEAARGPAAQGFSPASSFTLAALGTDGVDGNSPAAGAVVDAATVDRAREAGFDLASVLAANDSYALFDRLGDAIVTGPTGTNVGDVFLAMIEA
jgi:glycerate-2-kinase